MKYTLDLSNFKNRMKKTLKYSSINFNKDYFWTNYRLPTT